MMDMVEDAPEEYLCPLTLDIMKDPVMSKYGQSFERSEILQWLKSGHGVCPLSRRPLKLQDLVTNHALKLRISQWRKEQGDVDTVSMRSNINNSQIYGFITLPTSKHDDATDRTLDEDEDFLHLRLAVMRLGHSLPPPSQQSTAPREPVGRTRRQRRFSAPDDENHRHHRSNRRHLRGRLRSLFAGP